MTVSTFLNTTLCTFFTKTYHEHFSSCCKFIKGGGTVRKKNFCGIFFFLTLLVADYFFSHYLYALLRHQRREGGLTATFGFWYEVFFKALVTQ